MFIILEVMSLNKEVNGIILNQIKLFDTLQKYLEEQKEFIRNNKLFELRIKLIMFVRVLQMKRLS